MKLNSTLNHQSSLTTVTGFHNEKTAMIKVQVTLEEFHCVIIFIQVFVLSFQL